MKRNYWSHQTCVGIACLAWHDLQPLEKNPRSNLPPSSYLGPPMSHVGLDLFDFGGKQHLMWVDHWSRYPMFSTLSSTTSSAVIGILRPCLTCWVGLRVLDLMVALSFAVNL